jgi:hypothetical protein
MISSKRHVATHPLRRHRRLVEMRRQHILRYALQTLHSSFPHQSHRRQALRRPGPLVHGICHGIFADLLHEADGLDWSHGLEENHCS